MTDACHWDGEQRVTARHERDCNTSGCAGCEPCRERHCSCRRHLRDGEQLTCARCVGKTRDHLERIADLCRLAPLAATERSIGSALMVLAGPVPEHSTHAARRARAYGGGLCCCTTICPDTLPMPAGPLCKKAEDKKKLCRHHVCRRLTYRPTCPGLAEWLEYSDDEKHPLWVLGTWDMLIAEHLEHHRRYRVTIDSAVAYLGSNLTYLAQDRTFSFTELAREIRDCLEHVEQVMGVAAYLQRGLPCSQCERHLERQYGAGEDDRHDRWVCPSSTCNEELTLEQHDERLYREYLAKAKVLTTAQILAQYRVPEATVRQWATREKVDRRGFDGNGRQLYDVAQVLAARDGEQAATAS